MLYLRIIHYNSGFNHTSEYYFESKSSFNTRHFNSRNFFLEKRIDKYKSSRSTEIGTFQCMQFMRGSRIIFFSWGGGGGSEGYMSLSEEGGGSEEYIM